MNTHLIASHFIVQLFLFKSMAQHLLFIIASECGSNWVFDSLLATTSSGQRLYHQIICGISLRRTNEHVYDVARVQLSAQK